MDIASLVPVFEIMILLLVITFTLYGVVLGYHWYSYGGNNATATTMLMVYGAGCSLLLLGMTMSLTLL